MSDPLWLFQREAARFVRERATVRRWWRDAAGMRIDGRYLGEHERLAAGAASRLGDQTEASAEADRAATQAVDATGSANESLGRSADSLQRGGEEIRTALEHAQSASELGQDADGHLQSALDMLGRAGSACGESTVSASRLRGSIRDELPREDTRLRELLGTGAEAAEALGEPLGALARRAAGPLAEHAVGAGAAAVQIGPAVYPLLARGAEGDVTRRLARREVTRFQTRLSRMVGR